MKFLCQALWPGGLCSNNDEDAQSTIVPGSLVEPKIADRQKQYEKSPVFQFNSF